MGIIASQILATSECKVRPLISREPVSLEISVAPPERAHFRSSSSSLVLVLTGLTQLAQRDRHIETLD
jgi:hypothetical protein